MILQRIDEGNRDVYTSHPIECQSTLLEVTKLSSRTPGHLCPAMMVSSLVSFGRFPGLVKLLSPAPML